MVSGSNGARASRLLDLMLSTLADLMRNANAGPAIVRGFCFLGDIDGSALD
jgi:hypothetical protein